MTEHCREFEPYGQQILGVGDGNLVCWELCGPAASSQSSWPPPVFDNIVLELRTENFGGVRTFNGLLPPSHPEKLVERFTGSSL